MWLLLQSIFGAVSLTLYVIVTYLMIRERKHFSTSFLTLFIVFTIVNILSYISLYMALRLPIFTTSTSPLAGLFNNFPFPSILPYFIFLCYYLPFCQNITILLTIFNRFRVIAFPYVKESVSEIPISLVIIFIAPLPLAYKLLYKRAYYVYREPFKGYVLIGEATHERERLLHLVIFECGVALLGMVINTIGIVLLRRKPVAQSRRKETRLFTISCISFIFQSLNALATLNIYIFATNPHAVIYGIIALPICNDLNALSLPYYFLLINNRIQKSFLQLPLCQRFATYHPCEGYTKPQSV